MVGCKIDRPPSNTRSGITPPTPLFTSGEIEHRATNRVTPPEPRPPLPPESPPRSIIDRREEATTDFSDSGFYPTALVYEHPAPVYGHPAQDWSYPEGLFLSTTLSYPEAPGPQAAISPIIDSALPDSGMYLADHMPYWSNLESPFSTTLSYPVVTEPQVPAFRINLIKIPQRSYHNGRRHLGFRPLEPISFSVQGHPGMNLGDALRQSFTGLDGRDDLILQGAPESISCRLLVGFS